MGVVGRVGMVGEILVGVIGVEQGLVQQPADMDVGCGVIHERPLAAGLHQPGQPEFGQVLADRSRCGADEISQARHR